MSEVDPNGKNSHELGAKLDAGKPAVWRGLLDYFPRACLAVAEVSTLGAKKYAWKGWEVVPDGISRYGDALGRHILAESTDGLWDNGPKGIGVLHAAQVAWNALARLELLIREQDAAKSPACEPRNYESPAGTATTYVAPKESFPRNRTGEWIAGVDGDDEIARKM